MEDRVGVTMSEGVADVRLVRADKMNALDAAMFEALVGTVDRLGREKGLRAVVLSGEGRAFCAGLDMGRFAAMKESGGNGIAGGEKRDLAARTHGLANFPQQAVWGWRQLPVPVIAAIQGVAFGGGFQLALGADIRLLSHDALQYGLAARLCDDPHAEAMQLAREIAGKSPDAIRAAKRMLNNLSVDPGPALLAESVEQQKLIGSANQTEAVRANLEKRAAKYMD